mgnify:CR=1 FL=1
MNPNLVAVDEFLVDPSSEWSMLVANSILLVRLRDRRADLFVAQVRAKIAHQQALAILENRKGN